MLQQLIKSVKKEKRMAQVKNPKEVVWSGGIVDMNLHRQEGIEGVYYIGEYVNSEQSDSLWEEVNQREWVTLPYARRRVQRIGGVVGNGGLEQQENLPQYLLDAIRNLNDRGVCTFPLNHVLINEYTNDVGIMEHFDGPLYQSYVNVISLGAAVVLFFKEPLQQKQVQLLIEPRSLLVFTGEAYSKWQHGIQYQREDVIAIQFQDNQIVASSVINSRGTLLFQVVEQLLQSPHQGEVQFKYLNQSATIVQVHGDTQYNYAIIIQRSTRVSITIRNVFTS